MKITEALVAEHTILLNVFDQIERALPSFKTLAEVQAIATILEGLLVKHGDTENNLAYLALDHALADKGKLKTLHQEHEEIDNDLKRVRSSSSVAEARRLMKSSFKAVRSHLKHEERHLFPLIEGVLQEETLTELGRAWLQRPGLRKSD